jgi:hypothetical protein
MPRQVANYNPPISNWFIDPWRDNSQSWIWILTFLFHEPSTTSRRSYTFCNCKAAGKLSHSNDVTISIKTKEASPSQNATHI